MELGRTYHIYNHANGADLLFRESENYLYFLQKLKIYVLPVADIYAYCLMPNHFHFLIKIKSEAELADLSGYINLKGLTSYEKQVSQCFSNFFNSYAKAYNKRFDRRGSLFERRLKAKGIENIDQWLETFLYIHLNPIKHGFSNDVEVWNWSSWHAYEDFTKQSLLNRSKPYLTLIILKTYFIVRKRNKTE